MSTKNRSHVVLLTQVDPTSGAELDPGYYGVRALPSANADGAIVRAARTLSELAEQVCDLCSDRARFEFVLREFPVGHFNGEAFSEEEDAAWRVRPVVDPKPFVPVPEYPTSSEVVRIDVIEPDSGAVRETTLGLVARSGYAGTTIVDTEASSFADLSTRVPQATTHPGRWRAIEAAGVTIGTIDDKYKDPVDLAIEQMMEG